MSDPPRRAGRRRLRARWGARRPAYWQTRTPEERLATVEELRRRYYGPDYDTCRRGLLSSTVETGKGNGVAATPPETVAAAPELVHRAVLRA